MLLRQISIDQSRSPASGLCFSSSSPFARFVLPTKRNCEFDFSKFWRKVFIPHSLDLISFASLHDFQCGLLLGLSLWWIKKLLRSVFGCFSYFLIESVEKKFSYRRESSITLEVMNNKTGWFSRKAFESLRIFTERRHGMAWKVLSSCLFWAL